MKTLLVLALALVFLIPLGQTALAAPDINAATGKTTRQYLKGTMQSTETYSTAFHILFITANGTGEATELGRFTASYQMEANLMDMSVIESVLFIGANGDSMQADAVGQAIEDRTPGMFKIVEIYTVTGGTGRFNGASGTLTLNRLLSFSTGVAYSTFEGYLVIPSN